jgi:photosystem II stability/assembly factor-like uncharacterized protein
LIGRSSGSSRLPVLLSVLGSLSFLATSAGAAEQGKKPAEPSTKARLAPRSLLLDVSAREGRLVAVGERGHILVSKDSGVSWVQADVPTRVMLTGVFMHDAQLGWAVGHDQVILRTRDGGLKWEQVHGSPENEKPLLDIWFQDARRGLAIGAYGRILSTDDGGDTWQPRAVNGDDDFHLNQIAAAKDGTLYLAAEAGHLYRSEDAGLSWKPLPSPYKGSFFGLLPLSDGLLLVFGLRGNLFRSADRGSTWEKIETASDATLTSGIEIGSGRFVVGGMAGTLLFSEIGGRTVRKQEQPDRKAIVGMARANESALLLFGEGGVRKVEIPR